MDSRNQMIAAAGTLSICLLGIATKLAQEKKPRRSRRVKLKPWLEERHQSQSGNIQMLLHEFNLCEDLKSDKSYLLMDELCFMELLSHIEADISKRNTTMRLCVPAKERLACTLRFLATGENIKELSKKTKLSTSFVRKAILEVCVVIYRNLKDKYLMFPNSKEKWLEIAKGFESLCQFPHCLGALDGKHIEFTPPKEKQHLFYNSKGLSSIVLLAMCDANCKFTYVNIGYNGRISDGDVLKRSDLMTVLNQGERVFPDSDAIGNNRKVPYVVVADNAFPNMKHLLTPYSRNRTEESIINFNARLSRAHQNIERAFGVLTNRFGVLQTKIKVGQEKTIKIVQCCVVLHNFLVEKSPWYRQHLNEIAISNGFEDDEEHSAGGEPEKPTCKEIENVRQTFVEYFSNEGHFKK